MGLWGISVPSMGPVDIVIRLLEVINGIPLIIHWAPGARELYFLEPILPNNQSLGDGVKVYQLWVLWLL